MDQKNFLIAVIVVICICLFVCWRKYKKRDESLTVKDGADTRDKLMQKMIMMRERNNSSLSKLNKVRGIVASGGIVGARPVGARPVNARPITFKGIVGARPKPKALRREVGYASARPKPKALRKEVGYASARSKPKPLRKNNNVPRTPIRHVPSATFNALQTKSMPKSSKQRILTDAIMAKSRARLYR